MLVLEDLHWSDVATVNLLTYLERRDPARLLGWGRIARRTWWCRRTRCAGCSRSCGRGVCDELALELLRRGRGVYGGAAGWGGDGRAGGATVSPDGGQRPVPGEPAGAPGGARDGETGGRPVDAPVLRAWSTSLPDAPQLLITKRFERL